MFSGKRVLVLDGGSRQILPVLKGLSEIGCNVTTFNSSRLDNGYVSRYADRKILVSGEAYHEVYAAVLQEVKTNHYDVIIPVTDNSMDIMTGRKADFEGLARLPIPDRDVFLKAYNKQQTMEICMDIGVPCPVTKRETESVDEFLRTVGFPIIAKPRMACGSVGLKIIQSREQLDALLENGSVVLDDYVLQEFIPQNGKQINIHLFMSDGDVLSAGIVTEKTRWYPVDGGASCMCRTIRDDAIRQQCEKLLKAIHWRSYCEIEMIVDPRDGIAKVMEINGRASASMKIMDLVNVNVAKMMMQLAYGEPVNVVEDVRQDVRMRRISTDFLWFLQAKDRFSRKPSWFSLVRMHEVVFSLKDPLPFFATGLKMIGSVAHYKEEMGRRNRT